MSDIEIALAIRAGAAEIADAMVKQRPRLVVVPMVFAGAHDMTDEEAQRIATAMQHAFEEALK